VKEYSKTDCLLNEGFVANQFYNYVPCSSIFLSPRLSQGVNLPRTIDHVAIAAPANLSEEKGGRSSKPSEYLSQDRTFFALKAVAAPRL
jgi:hypothetical protein